MRNVRDSSQYQVSEQVFREQIAKLQEIGCSVKQVPFWRRTGATQVTEYPVELLDRRFARQGNP
jgi:hypothetical protein